MTSEEGDTSDTLEQKPIVEEDADQQQQQQQRLKADDASDLADDTASSSSREDEGVDDDSLVDDDDDDDDDEAEPMPLLSYTRLFGSLPRRLSGDDSAPVGSTRSSSQPRTFLATSTCAVMGQVILSPEYPTTAAVTSSVSSPDANSGSNPRTAPSATASATTTPDQRRPSSAASIPSTPPSIFYGDPLLSQQPHFVVATGFADGTIALVDARTGVAVVSSDQLRLRDASHAESVIDLSMDSSGTFLAAVDEGRMACIWECRYTISLQQPAPNISSNNRNNRMGNSPSSALSPARESQQSMPPQSAPTTPSDAGVFSSFMSAFKGSATTTHVANSSNTPGNTPASSTARPNSNSPATVPATGASRDPPLGPSASRLATSSVTMTRISYPRSFGVPTCIAIDPSYKRKREKAVLTGFLDGRLVLTKRGFVFQRRTDAIIYQGTYDNSQGHGGIEAIEWRGSLAAWADASGIRLFDTESLTRIAHIDRPTGARPSLYPTLSSLKPTLCFETNSYLLVAWGDCLMGLSIVDPSQRSTTAGGGGQNFSLAESPGTEPAPPSSQHSMQQEQTVVRRRTVECAMAWELDCVAAGVVPLDRDNLLVLGLVPPSDDDDDDDVENGAGQPTNDLEVQIISREDGSITFSNILPILRNKPTRQQESVDQVAQSTITESSSDYRLLSSFALPRMEDVYEISSEDENTSDVEFDIQVSLFSPTSHAKPFKDSHLKWNLKASAFEANEDEDDNEGDETGSVDSDDYGFIFRPLSTGDDANDNQRSAMTPPQMIVASGYDMVLARMRDVDDVVAHALSLGKSAMALRRGLKQKRRLRKYQISELVNAYLSSLLRLPRADTDTSSESQTPPKPLSIERLKLAAKAMPVLFGADTILWERWVSEFEKIPGGVFILSDHMPVRDPKLRKKVYGHVLDTMLNEIGQMEKEGEASALAGQCFLNTLTGWGPTDFLKEHIKLCKFDTVGNTSAARASEVHFARRFTQSAANYLIFPVPNENTPSSDAGPQIRSEGYYDMKSALFDIDDVTKSVERRIPLLSGAEPQRENENSLVALDAMAKLNMMRFRYDAALKCFLFIGALHSTRSVSDFEAGAVDFSDRIGSREIDKSWQSETAPYTYLLDIIDNHHLQQCLLDGQFMSASIKENQTLPLFSLLQLVGFNEMGRFLVTHCVPPQFVDKKTLQSHEDEHVSTSGEERRGTLPLDLVARQLEGRPQILHWYLHLIFTRKPEVYVRFPNTAYPARAVTELHRRHFDLYVGYVGSDRDSAVALSGVEAYKVGRFTTQLLQFLKAALPLGGIRKEDARHALEVERAKDDVEFSSTFALELAFLFEHYGKDTELEAREILELYMKGAKSLVLAVSFAQRNEAYSGVLWDAIMEHCLANSQRGEDATEEEVDGSLFGALLEAAALSGADLAHLVTQIPHGMAIEGLRPRLVAAVADYRLKLKMHQAASETSNQEMINILRELSHRSRRGVRYAQVSSRPLPSAAASQGKNAEGENPGKHNSVAPNVLDRSLRTIHRRDRERLCLAPPLS